MEILARGHPLISDRDPEGIPERTSEAMLAAAAVGYLYRDVQAQRSDEPSPEPQTRGSGEELAERAAQIARDAGVDFQSHALRERTLAIIVREDESGGVFTPGGAVQDATLDDFRRVWSYGFLVRQLGGPSTAGRDSDPA